MPMTSAFTAKNVTFRTYEAHAALVERAADKAGKTISEYCRDIMVPIAAEDLGVPVPPLPDMKRGRYNEVLERAAKLTGMTPDEFQRQASERMAAAVLGFTTDTETATPIHPKLSPRSETKREARDTPAPARRRARG